MSSYCPAPWRNIEITSEGFSPCCYYYPIATKEKYQTVSEAALSPAFENIRQKMLSGEKIKNCEECYRIEEYGGYSKRNYLLDMYGRVDDVKITSLTYVPDNICNLKCRGCNSGAAHLWYDDEVKVFGKSYSPTKYAALELNVDNITDLQQIEVTGGEPFHSPKVYKLLRDIDATQSAGNMEFIINTNLTVVPEQDILKVLLNFKKIILGVSIDGIGELNNYFRSGSKFDEIQKNLDFYYDYCNTRDNFLINVVTTVTVYNINELKQIELFLLKYPKINWTIKLCHYPTFLNISHLPQDYKTTLLNIVSNWGTRYQQLIDALHESQENQFGHFLNFHESLDQIRNEQCPNNLLNSFIEKYKSTNGKIDSKVFFIQHVDSLNNDL